MHRIVHRIALRLIVASFLGAVVFGFYWFLVREPESSQPANVVPVTILPGQ